MTVHSNSCREMSFGRPKLLITVDGACQTWLGCRDFEMPAYPERPTPVKSPSLARFFSSFLRYTSCFVFALALALALYLLTILLRDCFAI